MAGGWIPTLSVSPARAALWLGLLLLAACGGMDHAGAGGSVEVSDAWARTSAMDQQMGVAYMTIHGGADGDTLTGVSVPTDIAASATMHETVMADAEASGATTGDGMDMGDTTAMSDGSMTMREVKSIEVPADGMVMLKPGGFHIMLMELARPLAKGETFDLTLHFEKAGDTTVTVTVKDA